jgi:hypothetical protein
MVNIERYQQGFRGSFDSRIEDPDWEVAQPLGEKGSTSLGRISNGIIQSVIPRVK